MVNALFQSIATDLGFQVVLGENNLCNVKRKSTGEETIIELSRNEEMLYIYAVISDVPFNNRENFFEFVLKLNLHGSSTGYGILGIDAQTNKFVLSRLLHIKNLDEQLLLNAVSSFFSTISQLREKLSQFLQVLVSDQDTAFEGPLVSTNLNFVI
ncbi:MAG: CesT family type III secretion system chaperone [Puniceicoccales bacterium]|jgi:hypothetical protein|nr:CesT family type III secretion system chaperone [Puniceicoccales bacterium]